MEFERKFAKDSWKINFPPEIAKELGWNKGDNLIIKLEDGIVTVRKNENPSNSNRTKTIKETTNKSKNNRKKTPCGFYEFSRNKYVNNKCANCDKSEMFFKNGISCPLAEKETENVVKEIAENIENERKIDEKDIKIIEKKLTKEDEEVISAKSKKLKRLQERYDRLSKSSIRLLSSLDPEEKEDYLHQQFCGICKQPLLRRSNIIKDDKLICKNCKNLVAGEIKELIMLRKEIDNLKGEFIKWKI